MFPCNSFVLKAKFVSVSVAIQLQFSLSLFFLFPPPTKVFATCHNHIFCKLYTIPFILTVCLETPVLHLVVGSISIDFISISF